MSRNGFFGIAAVALTAGVIELISVAFFQFHAKNHYGDLIRPDFEGRVERLTEAEIERHHSYHDSVLGWDEHPSHVRHHTNTAGEMWSNSIDDSGARADTRPASSAVIAAFGDSYTFGHEVEDDETWPHYLSELTGTRVLNFGVGAYGMDQALLKLQRKIDEGLATPIVIFAVWSGGLDRLLNSYRPFYRPETGLVLGFKPMLVKRGGDYVWLPNPLPRLRHRDAALDALERAAAHDLWLQARVVSDRFPYTLRLLQLAGAVLRDERRDRNRPWDDARATSRLAFLVEALRGHAKAHGYRPVVVFIPTSDELRRRLAGEEAPYAPFVAEMARRYGGSGLTLVDIYATAFDERRFNVTEFGSHLSPYGNRIVAREIGRVVEPLLAAELKREEGR